MGKNADWCDIPMTEEQAAICHNVWGGDEDLAGDIEDLWERDKNKSSVYWSNQEIDDEIHDSLADRPEVYSTHGYTSDFEDWGQKAVARAVKDEGLTSADVIYSFLRGLLHGEDKRKGWIEGRIVVNAYAKDIETLRAHLLDLVHDLDAKMSGDGVSDGLLVDKWREFDAMQGGDPVDGTVFDERTERNGDGQKSMSMVVRTVCQENYCYE